MVEIYPRHMPAAYIFRAKYNEKRNWGEMSVTRSYLTYPDNRDKQQILHNVGKSQSGYTISHPKTANFIRYSVFCNMWSTCQYVSNTCQTHSKM